jgi:hypothetical protein
MSKFKKRLSKITNDLDNAIIYGTAFNKLEEILDLFNTVFVLSNDPLKVRAKNIVYLPDLHQLNDFTGITMTFVDKDKTNDLSPLIPILVKGNSMILIEGRDIIGRDKSKLLYTYRFQAISQFKTFHVWKQGK